MPEFEKDELILHTPSGCIAKFGRMNEEADAGHEEAIVHVYNDADLSVEVHWNFWDCERYNAPRMKAADHIASMLSYTEITGRMPRNMHNGEPLRKALREWRGDNN